MRKQFKAYRKSMRVLIITLVTLLCLNGLLTVSAMVRPTPVPVENNVSKAKVIETETNVPVTSEVVAEVVTEEQVATPVQTEVAAVKEEVVAPAPVVAASAPSNGVESLRGTVTPALMSAFDQLAFNIVVNPNAANLGYFSTSKHSIELRSVSTGTFRHEMGHFLDVVKNMPSRSSEFTIIYTKEKDLYTGTSSSYIRSTAQEYFAQSYRNYLENPSQLQAERPETYAFIEAQISSVSAADIDRTYGQYSWSW